VAPFGGVGASLDEGGAQGRLYGPPLGAPPTDDQDAYVRPARRLQPRAVAVLAGSPAQPVQLAELNTDRRSLTVSNALGTATVWIGDSPNLQPGPAAAANSFPVAPGATVTWEPREYVGPVYAVLAPGAAAQVVYVAELAG